MMIYKSSQYDQN